MTSSPPFLPSIFLFVLLPPPFLAHFCFSCSGICQAGAPCNCQMGSCQADFCFADKRPSDSTGGVFTLTKGCVKRPQRTRVGCDFAHHSDHVRCICSGNFCNDSVLMRVNTSRRNVTCRKCSDSRPNCGHTCQGQWCHLHVSTSATGCGFGPPSLPFVYQSYEMFGQRRNKVCVSLSRGNASPHEICVCNSNLCNDPPAFSLSLAGNSPPAQSPNAFAALLRSLGAGEMQSQQKWANKSPAGRSPAKGAATDALFECVSCDMSSEDAAMTSNCRQNRCWGHFCVYATQRVFVGGSFQSLGWSGASAGPQGNGAVGTQQAMMHERQGCMNTSERTFVQLGCSHKWVANEQEEIFCACRGNLCNSDLSSASASSVPRPNSPDFRFLCAHLFLIIFFFHLYVVIHCKPTNFKL
ncbi:hypothetical protein niasHT_036390 [Heterodera trifolii]|uniref:Uncharacterized protein n=1 Tax=Heterodera trifolii TaxID=157864 RepID=A0ABD2IJF8_9BILA